MNDPTPEKPSKRLQLLNALSYNESLSIRSIIILVALFIMLPFIVGWLLG